MHDGHHGAVSPSMRSSPDMPQANSGAEREKLWYLVSIFLILFSQTRQKVLSCARIQADELCTLRCYSCVEQNLTGISMICGIFSKIQGLLHKLIEDGMELGHNMYACIIPILNHKLWSVGA